MKNSQKCYFVTFKKYEPIFVWVEDDVNRPNNLDCDQVLEDWIVQNYCKLENCNYSWIDIVSYAEMSLAGFEEYEI